MDHHLLKVKDLHIIKAYLIGWFLANLLWRLLTNPDFDIDRFYDGFTPKSIAVFIVLWLGEGILFGSSYIIVTKYIAGKIKYVQLLMLSLILQLIIFTGVLTGLFYFLSLLGIEFPARPIELLHYPSILIAFIYILIINFSISFVLYVNAIMGSNNLKKMLLGKFYSPTVVEKVFMFIDLKGSTQLAERLGHIEYSKLIQDCFRDIAVVHRYGAEIYQYVGDEVVLTWDFQKAVDKNNCIHALFAFYRQLIDKAAYYRTHYDVVPEFKAGVHGGIITMAEIGELKRDIAYHGDTINTAARLQGECKKLDMKLLISESFLTQLNLKTAFKTKLMGEMQLRGKNAPIRVFAIEENDLPVRPATRSRLTWRG